MKALLFSLTLTLFLFSPVRIEAAMRAVLQGQSYGNTNWVSVNLSGWHELEYVPVRVYLTGGPAANQSIRVDFDHSKGTVPGIQNLSDFTSTNVVFNSGPTLLSPVGSDTWSYTFNINLTEASGWVEFRARLAAGAHYFGGSSLSMGGSPSLGVLQIAKPAPVPGDPDLAIAKVGPSQANPGSIVTYTLSYTNHSGSPGTGVQVVDTLPAMVQFVGGSGNYQQVGNTIIWDLEDLPRGNGGSFTYSVLVTNNALNGQTFQNYASILSAENDVDSSNNTASVTTTIVNGCIPPQFTSHPVSSQSCEGSSVFLSVSANGTAPLSYQWRRNGEDISGATNNQLTITSLASSNAGSYDVIVANACGSVTSSSASIILAELTIATPLSSVTNCIGDNASFSTTASGNGPFTYTWYKDGAVLLPHTNEFLTIDAITTEDEGEYKVVVAGFCTSVTNSATLTVSEMTASSLEEVTRCAGESAMFSTVASGIGPFTYVWRKNGVLLNGMESNSLVFESVLPGDAGVYSVEVTGPCRTITNSAALNLYQPTEATPLHGVISCAGEQVVFSTVASGTGPFTYVWRRNGELLIDATGNSLVLESISAVDAGSYSVEIAGACNVVTNSATLTLNEATSASPLVDASSCPGQDVTFVTVAFGTGPFAYVWHKDGVVLNNETAHALTLSSIEVEHAGVYSVIVSGACNSTTNSATLTVRPITASTPLSDIALCVGSGANFSTTASGDGPFTYSWFKDGTLLPGHTDHTFTLPSITADDAGDYTVVVSGTCNSVTNTGKLTLLEATAATPLSNLTLCVGSDAAFSTTVSGQGPFTYVWHKDGTVLGGQTDHALTLSSIDVDSAGIYSVVVSGACASVTNSATLTLIERVAATPLTSLIRCAGENAAFSTFASGAGPFTYAWRKDGVLLAGQESSSLSLVGITPAQAGVYSVEVSGACNTVTNSATLTINAAVSGTDLLDTTRCIGESASFSTIPSGTGPFTFIWRKEGSVLTGATSNTLQISSVSQSEAGTYSVEVTGACGSFVSSAQLSLNIPVSTTPLTNITRCSCESVTFSTAPSGTGPFTFVWKLNGDVIPGASNAQLELHNVKSTDSGVISVEVSGPCSTAVQSASLLVTDEPAASPSLHPQSDGLIIKDAGPSSPFPSVLQLSCVPGTIEKLTVTLHGFKHTFPEDVDVLLVGPNGKGIILMSDAGSDYAATNVTVTFDDDASSFVPEHTRILNGTYKPTNHGGADPFPGVPGSIQFITSLEAFTGIPANGNWSLYIMDDANLDSGSLEGWSINVTWAEPQPQILSLEFSEEGSPSLWILGASNKTHVVEASADLQTWIPISTNGLHGAAALISDPQADRGLQQFYRVYRAR